MTQDQLISNILSDIEVELSDEFDRNFSQGSFFGDPWPNKRSGEPSHLISSGKLRRSIRSQIIKNGVRWTSSEVYAAIHNEGGTITVTEKMKKYFWAMYAKTKLPSYKRMALMKVGKKIKMPKRQFIGNHARVDRAVERCIDDNVKYFLESSIVK